MAFRGITFSKQTVSSNDDAHVYQLILSGRKGRTKGCGMTYSADNIFIDEGRFFVANRMIEVTSTETISTPVVTSTTYFRLVFEVDLTKANTSSDFAQGYFRILSSATDYPAITQEDLENGGSVYQLPFARFTKSVSGIDVFASELETIGFATGNTTIYVSKSGNDASGDGSANAPFATIKRALDSVPKNIEGKEITIDIASGTYSEDVVISGLSGAPLRFNIATITINSLHVYDSCVIFNGSTITISASGKTYGLYAHRDSNVICQTDLIINGAEYGIYCGYGSRVVTRKATTINSCTFAATCTFAGVMYIPNLAGSKNNNAIQAAGGIVMIGTIAAAMASTMYVTSNGGRILTGSQASVPSY